MPAAPEPPVAALLHAAARLLAPAHATAIDDAADAARILAAHPIRIVIAVDHALRDRGEHRRAGLAFIQATAADVPAPAALGSYASAGLGLASAVRSGYVREAAVRSLGGIFDVIATAFLLCRVSDVVPRVGAAAAQALETRIVPAHASLLVACLPVIERLASRKRGRAPIVEATFALLASDDPACAAALWDGTRARDSEVRRAACALLVRRLAGRPEMARVLEAALADPDPATRAWAAEVARQRALTPEPVQALLLDRMEQDRAPSVRLMALRARARGQQLGPVARAVFDGNANVRFYARKYLAARGAHLDQRAEALALLERALDDPSAVSRPALIGALAALSEAGHATDRSLVARFTTDPRPTVAREAKRTLARLPESEGKP